MTEAEKDSLRQSIKEAEELLAKGLFLPEDASQLRRMIAYYEDKLKEDTAIKPKEDNGQMH